MCLRNAGHGTSDILDPSHGISRSVWMLVAEGDVLFSLCEAGGGFEDSLSLPPCISVNRRQTAGEVPTLPPSFPSVPPSARAQDRDAMVFRWKNI